MDAKNLKLIKKSFINILEHCIGEFPMFKLLNKIEQEACEVLWKNGVADDSIIKDLNFIIQHDPVTRSLEIAYRPTLGKPGSYHIENWIRVIAK